MRIKLGEYEILHSGSIVTVENDFIDFFIAEDIGFTIRIVFEDDLEIKDSIIVAETFDKVGAKLIFKNFNTLGTGNVTPIKIGTLNFRELFLNYRVGALDKGGKTLNYTWLLGKEVKDGK